MRLEEPEVGHRRRHHHQLAGGLHAQCLGGTDPEALDGLLVVVQRLLVSRQFRDEEPGVEPASFADRRDPVVDVVRRGQVEHEVVAPAQFDQRQRAVVDLVAILVAQRQRAAGARRGEQHTGLLEALADRGDPVGETAAVDAELAAGGLVVETAAEPRDVVRAVDAVDPTSGEHEHPGTEHGVRRASQHEDLEAGCTLGCVAHHHHRRCRLDGDERGVEGGVDRLYRRRS